MKTGIDVSTWQGVIDFAKVKNSIDFVIFRSSFRFTTDNKFRANCKDALKNNVPVLGIYHFSYALTTEDAVKEADYCISEAVLAGLTKDTIIFFDYEYDSVNYAKKKGIQITKKDINNMAIAFCETCVSRGYKTGIYLNQDYYKNIYYPSTISEYYIWLADYCGGASYPCDIQQYTSTGKVTGINGNVDMNYILNDAIVFWEKKDKLSVKEIAQEVINGKWGNGMDRKDRLTAAGYDYSAVQEEVNTLLNTPKKDAYKQVASIGLASGYDTKYFKRFVVTEKLYLRVAAGANKTALCFMPVGTIVTCYGYFEPFNGVDWLYVQTVPFNDGVVYTGFCSTLYLK